jgi:hypothetical protein
LEEDVSRQNAATQDHSVLDERAAAVFLGAKPGTLGYWRRLGTSPTFMIYGRNRVRYRVSDLIAWQQKRLHCVDEKRSA